MATAAKINTKNIDYFKFKKIVVDGNRDDYAGCSREVKALCDSVQTLSFRDEEFDDVSDRSRFDDIIIYYKQILSSKRIDPTDIRVKNGWWLDVNSGNVCSAGKFKPAALKETLVVKTREWLARHGAAGTDLKPENVPEKLEGPGLFIFKHKERQCFQYVGKADKIFTRCAEKLKSAFDGTLNEPLGALMIISMAGDWDFYFIPVKQEDGSDLLRILENDVILKHDSIWPHGLNFSLHIDSLLEVAEFRKSCLRHHWPPPETDTVDETELDLDRLRRVEVKSVSSEDSKTAPAPGRSENGARDSADSHSPSDQETRLPSAREKTPTENEEHRTQANASNASETSNRKMPSTSTKQSTGTASTSSSSSSSNTRKLTRPSSASAPKPPPLKQGGPNRPKSPAFSKEHAKRTDALHRSLDTNDARSSPAKFPGGTRHQPLERPRSSLDGRRRATLVQAEDAPKPINVVVADGKSGMIRSKSVTSTISIDSRKEKSREPAKASGIKAPAARRPTTAKIIPSTETDLHPESNTT